MQLPRKRRRIRQQIYMHEKRNQQKQGKKVQMQAPKPKGWAAVRFCQKFSGTCNKKVFFNPTGGFRNK